MHENREQFDKWTDMWEKAQESDAFKSAPKPPEPSQQTSDNSFFGLQNTHPTDEIKDVDSTYWNQVHQAAAHGDLAPDPLDNAESVISEARKKQIPGDKVSNQTTGENPIRASSIGMDQEMEPRALGVTFTPEEIEELTDLKTKLHELQDKKNTAEGKGSSGKRFESQIQSLWDKIEDLSDTLNQVLPSSDAETELGG